MIFAKTSRARRAHMKRSSAARSMTASFPMGVGVGAGVTAFLAATAATSG